VRSDNARRIAQQYRQAAGAIAEALNEPETKREKTDCGEYRQAAGVVAQALVKVAVVQLSSESKLRDSSCSLRSR
jgi:hypothetical protein